MSLLTLPHLLPYIKKANKSIITVLLYLFPVWPILFKNAENFIHHILLSKILQLFSLIFTMLYYAEVGLNAGLQEFSWNLVGFLYHIVETWHKASIQ